MQFNNGVLLVVFFLTFQCHFLVVSGNIPSTKLEASVELKLRIAASVRNNIGKIFNRLKSNDWELRQSLEQVQRYLANGGSLIESLHLLPGLSYAPVDKQFNGILIALEKYSPRYLLPAISVIRDAFIDSSNPFNIEDMLQPSGGPLRVDIFEGILAKDLTKLLLPTPFPRDVERYVVHGPWPSFIQKVMVSISMGFLNHSSTILGLILENLVNFSHDPETMKSMKKLLLNLDVKSKEISDLKSTTDPYELLKNILSNVAKKSSTVSVLTYLNEHLNARENVPKITDFFVGEKINYSLILMNDKQFMKTKSAKALLSQIQNNESLLKNVFDDFQYYEYRIPDDLLMAVVSKLRRYQAHEGTISEVVDNVYENLIQTSRRASWKQIPRSSGALKALLYGVKTDKNAKKIRRLAGDISASLEGNVRPEAWLKVANYAPELNCYGPSCTVLRTLEGIQELEAIEDQALNASVTQLVKLIHKQYRGNDIFDSCPTLLADDPFVNLKPIKTANKTVINVDDLMQAIPELDVNSEQYKILREFLASIDLDKRIGESIDKEAHPTRGRLLAWLLEKIESITEVEEEIRNAAAQLADTVSYDGYGAAPVALRSISSVQ